MFRCDLCNARSSPDLSLREGGHPYLGLFDLEKAFDSIEHSILLERLFEIGVNGRCWRIILNWYTSAQSKVHLNIQRCQAGLRSFTSPVFDCSGPFVENSEV